jgi:hypothetical protein
MAGNAHHSNRGMVGRVAKKAKKKLGVLVVFVEQCFVDPLGPA